MSDIFEQKVLVTGGAGFIGSNFCNINKNKFEITALDNLFLGSADNLDSDIKFIQGDACKEEDLKKCGDHFFAQRPAGLGPERGDVPQPCRQFIPRIRRNQQALSVLGGLNHGINI